MSSIHFLYASTSGNTEFVIYTLARYIQDHAPQIEVEIQRTEGATPEDLLRGDVVILASGTWNTGGIEGQLNMHMHKYLLGDAQDIDLHGKPMTCISLGDDRFYYRTRCTEHFLRFIREHTGTLATPPLIIVNEPYDQEEKIHAWGSKLLTSMKIELPTTPTS
jgi:flavodoxin I